MVAMYSWYCGRRPDPNPPPTNGFLTVTWPALRPNTPVTYAKLFWQPWLLS